VDIFDEKNSFHNSSENSSFKNYKTPSRITTMKSIKVDEMENQSDSRNFCNIAVINEDIKEEDKCAK